MAFNDNKLKKDLKNLSGIDPTSDDIIEEMATIISTAIKDYIGAIVVGTGIEVQITIDGTTYRGRSTTEGSLE
ncbi:MAG: hypothetical protein PHR20_02220 [Bacteroidales bacterium]|nr:hypothetical protein [Bacteroidales bacterium]